MRSEAQYKRIPSTVKPALQKIASIFVLILLSIILNQYFDEKYYLTDDFKQTPFIYKLPVMIGTLLMMMSTYVIGFSFMDCSCIASGLSYNGND